MHKTYCKKEFLTDSPEPSTSTVVSFSGDIQYGCSETPELVSFLEISSCNSKIRLHRKHEQTFQEWVEELRRLRDHINDYLNFFEEIKEGSK